MNNGHRGRGTNYGPLFVVLCLLLALVPVGCGSAKAKDVDIAALASELAQQVQFTSDIRGLASEQLADFLDVPEGSQSAFYMCSGSNTVEEIIAVKCASQKDAAKLKTEIEKMLANQIDLVGAYHPEVVPRLEHPVLVQRGECVVLCVTDDVQTAERIIKE